MIDEDTAKTAEALRLAADRLEVDEVSLSRSEWMFGTEHGYDPSTGDRYFEHDGTITITVKYYDPERDERGSRLRVS